MSHQMSRQARESRRLAALVLSGGSWYAPIMAKILPTWGPVAEMLGRPDGIVVGIDEVGRGAWAGPVTAAAVILPFGLQIDGVCDSKLANHQARCRLDKLIRRQAIGVGIGWVSATDVDEHGLSWAVRQSGLRALADLALEADLVLLDGNWNYLKSTHPSQTLIRADALCVPVAAASIVAKVARDRYMESLERSQPRYGFGSHRGYVTPAHKRAVAQYGFGPWHRRRWQAGFGELIAAYYEGKYVD